MRVDPNPYTCDYLVIGSGVAGLCFAIKAAAHGRVLVLSKRQRTESNTYYAQGGIAAVTSKDDSIENHVRDTLEAGAGLCDESAVRTIISEGPERIRELVDWGVEFTEREGIDTTNGPEYDLGREGGHSKRRILHAADATGRELVRVLTHVADRQSNITFWEQHMAIDLITTGRLGHPGPNRCIGAYVLDSITGRVKTVISPVVVLATGGCGKVYLYTSNPDVATGDGVAIAYRAGASIANMEFIQFHPTCLYHPRAKSFLISEAVRGEGAILRTTDGEPFMARYDPRAELAPRDIVARAIDAEMKRTGADYVLLDITHKPAPFIMKRFPNIYQTCLQYGLDMTKEPLPVVPAAHYQCGGVLADVNGQTDLPGLLAIGEVACTGLHGANRLASNSLLEGIVCAHRAAIHAAKADPLPPRLRVPPWECGSAQNPDEIVVVSHNWEEVRRCMWDYVGIVRTNKRLQRAKKRIVLLLEEIHEYYWDFLVTPDLLELRNIATVAAIIIECALQRKESRGLHYNLDHPRPDPTMAGKNTVVRKPTAGPSTAWPEPVQ